MENHLVSDDRVSMNGQGELTGTPVVAGYAYGPALWPGGRVEHDDRLLGADRSLADDDLGAEADRLAAAAATVAGRLRNRASHASGAAAEVLNATAGLAEDRGWIGAANKLVAAGTPAPAAVVAATQTFAEMFAKLGGLMAERITDLNDVRDRVVAELLGEPEPGIPTPTQPSVLLADDLAPADTAGLDPTVIVGLVTRLGGPTSHTAIIARQLGIPCVVAVAGLGEITSGTEVLIDGAAGSVVVEPDPASARELVERGAAEAALVAAWSGPGRTADGVDVAILANVADGASARSAADAPVEGIGLFRTELAFLDRGDEPSVDEQTRLYRDVLDAFDGQKVVIRTLDAGSDKPLAFIEHPDEANPALGVRGNRIAADHPEIVRGQLDAIARAATETGSRPWVMAPMIATAAEAAQFAGMVRERGLTAGVMIEIPAAAILARAILAEVDFVSIGTNDLTQYTMAADRMSAELAELTDPWQPAVLALIAQVADAGAELNKPVGVCGEAAADPALACVLVGLGVTSLSAAPAATPAVGAKLSTVTLDQCRAAAAAVLQTTSPALARRAAAEHLDD
ncbi:phosphoenolpyruvate--protein phosphotransferase [Gordonia otitidis]|uniref:phosphoenolpyruvate--protein phosphotransferase n=1 Tax=Gordonia otitidis TaxID=249058 RepID=UPI001D1492D3|nr:phosphoenolpyruvate--protein phosphotransferase [Gordonia otitidis]UEA59286.1 phosphoenolpyruvate--protein phosphotransferase [Gordonia otitidis]